MPRVYAPQILGGCPCGEILVEDEGKNYWTRDERVVRAAAMQAAKLELKEIKCPGCGGDPLVKVGAFYHPVVLATC